MKIARKALKAFLIKAREIILEKANTLAVALVKKNLTELTDDGINVVKSICRNVNEKWIDKV